MRVEARPLDYLFPYPPQLISNRGDFIAAKQLGGMNLYDTINARMDYGALPLRTSFSKRPNHEGIFPAFYQSSAACDHRTLPVKSIDSGLTTFNNSVLGDSRKRARDSVNYACGDAFVTPGKTRQFSVHDQDIALDIHHQQSELDQLITEHIQRMRLAIEEVVRQQSKELVAVIQQGMERKISEKDEEILKVAKLNLALQERIKTLCLDNQLLRGLARTSEAAANSLRSNLEQVLAGAHANEDRQICSAAVAVEEDAESCCGSSGGQEATEEEQTASGSRAIMRGLCRGCGDKESCVLLLPCRHLCLCTGCGSALHGCPVCGSVMTGTIHVNMS